MAIASNKKAYMQFQELFIGTLQVVVFRLQNTNKLMFLCYHQCLLFNASNGCTLHFSSFSDGSHRDVLSWTQSRVVGFFGKQHVIGPKVIHK